MENNDSGDWEPTRRILPKSRRDKWRMEDLSSSTPSPVDICRFPFTLKLAIIHTLSEILQLEL